MPATVPRSLALMFLAALLPTLLRAAPAPGPEDLGRPQGYLTDTAGALQPEDARRIEVYLGQVESALQVQFAVVIVPTVAPATIEEYAVKLFEKWGIGDAQRDEGLLLVVAVQERKVRFEVGYGLEGALPDGRVGGIIRQQIVPRFRDGDLAGGILDGVAAAAGFVAESKGLAAPTPGAARTARRRPTQQLPAPTFLLLLVGILVIAAISNSNRRGRRRRRGGWVGPWYGGGLGWPGGMSGGSGRGGGGFGGGGGGGGFGGFGGGASGGGGATGSW